jgi:hypothetical protein
MLYPLAFVLMTGGGVLCLMGVIGPVNASCLGMGISLIIGGLILIGINLVCSAAVGAVKAGVKLAATASYGPKEKIEDAPSPTAERESTLY